MTAADIGYASLRQQAEWVRTRALSPVEILEAHLQRVQSINPSLKAVVTLAEGSRERARQAEAALMRGESWGPLHGVPFTAKDCFDTAGVRTTRGSRLFQNRIPSRDATAVARLKQAGAILLGKTNLPEFALWSETSNEVFGQTVNPWNPQRTAGGSSGGEAAALAAGLSPLGIGTDLGGSNRLPSHYCGVVGFKPTQGRIPITGQFPGVMARHLHVGPLTRTVGDAALALSLLLGPDGRDPYAVPVAAPERAPWDAPLPPLKIGFFPEGPFAPVARTIQETLTRAAAKLEELGCRVQPVALEGWKRSKPIEMVMKLLVAEAAHYFEPVVAGRKDRLAPSVQRLLESPPPAIAEYVAALAGCEQLRVDLMQHFSTHDLLLLPTAPVTAPPHDAVCLDVDGQTVPAVHAASVTPAFGMTGSPAISVPFGLSPDGLPIGVQLVARHFEEGTLLRAAAALESTASLETRRPPL